VVGSEVDIASLVAESLGLELDIVNVSWEQWPLAVQSGDLEAVFSNVGVNAQRLQLFDFATYRQGVMAFTAPTGSDLEIEDAEDISGLTVAVGSGTNQERILLDWNAENAKAGREPATLEYFANVADTLLALQSGRIDTYLVPNPNAVYQASLGEVDIVGTVNAGWPNTTYVAATTLKGNGLVEAVRAALVHVLDDGTYVRTLDRWGLAGESVEEPVVNPDVTS
jgi:polar amino acid transport system substrate-binding protein